MRLPCLVIGLAGLLLAGCAASRSEPPATASTAAVEWAFDVRATRAPARLSENAGELEILNTVAAVITHDLKLPLPDTVLALAYTNDTRFAEGLARRGVPTEQIPDIVSRVSALAAGTTILLRADRLARQPVRVRAGLYAHELAHVAQRGQGGQLFTPLWLLEGHAEWVARRVVHILDLESYSQARDEVRRRVVASPLPRERFPALQELQTRPEWWEAARRFGWTPTYGQAFLAVDWLVEHHGEARVRGFLAKAGLRDVSVYTFLAPFRAYLHGLQ
jgi:hypothetical protein